MPLPVDIGEPFPIPQLKGQDSRSPVTHLEPGKASLSENTAHDSAVLKRAPGTQKVASTIMPSPCYEIDGINTGILVFPAMSGVDWKLSTGANGEGWRCYLETKFLALGDLQNGASDVGQIIFATANGPDASGDAVMVSIKIDSATGKYLVRVQWGATVATGILQEDSLGVALDPKKWFEFFFVGTKNPTSTLRVQWSQKETSPNNNSVTINRVATMLVKGLRVGGTLPDNRPSFEIWRPCHMLVADFRIYKEPFGNFGDLGTVRGGGAGSNNVKEVWLMTDSSTEPVGVLGTLARLVCPSVHRETKRLGHHTRGIYFDGSAPVFIPQAHRFREAPHSAGVPDHYLELPALTFGFFFAPDGTDPFQKIPQTGAGKEDRSCLFSFVTPYSENLGVSTDPVGPSGLRPSEHLRVEIKKNGTTGNYLLDAHFGELEPQSLKHPSGTPGGSGSTTWPPTLSSSNEPPVTWNKPQPAFDGEGLAGTKNAARITLGHDTAPPAGSVLAPMQYAWLIFVERKFVAQGSSSNKIAIYAYPFDPTTGLWRTDLGTGGVLSDPNGEKSPLNQSCFTAASINGTQVCFNPRNYVMTLGAAAPTKYGDEWHGLGGKLPGMYPVPGAGFVMTDRAEMFSFRGWMAGFFALGRFLDARDRSLIAGVGGMTTEMRTQFSADLIEFLSMDEAGGTVLRSSRGVDVIFDDKVITVEEEAVETVMPQALGFFPRASPPWHGEATIFPAEYGRITGIVQRFTESKVEELFVTSQSGIYQFDRVTRTLTRVGTLPGQGAPNRASIVLDGDRNIHVAGGKGRPVIINRNKSIFLAGIDPPVYAAPDGIQTQAITIPGGVAITFESLGSASLSALVGFEIPNGATVSIAIGYWSEALKTRSRPGPPISVRFTDPASLLPVSGAAPTYRYRVRLSGSLPIPIGVNASLISHWEVFRTDPGGRSFRLEERVPISSNKPSILVGRIPDEQLKEEAALVNAPPPEGIRYLSILGSRLFGVRDINDRRRVRWTFRGDPTNWPGVYTRQLDQTQNDATGARVRRDRMFLFQRDYMYEAIDSLRDTDPQGTFSAPVDLAPLANMVGALSHDAIVETAQAGLFVAGDQSVFATEGGSILEMSQYVDTGGSAGGSWTWPGSWDLTDVDLFVGFHDREKKLVGICGPSKDDKNRIDGLFIYYGHRQYTADGRPYVVPEISRVKGIGIFSVGDIINPTDGTREVWFGDDLGQLKRLWTNGSVGVDYSWLASVTPKYGEIIDVPSTTVLRLEGSWTGYPSELMRGAPILVYRAGVLISETRIVLAAPAASWNDVTTSKAHGAQPGDHFVVGSLPLTWRSGQIDFGTALLDKRVRSVDLRFPGGS